MAVWRMAYVANLGDRGAVGNNLRGYGFARHGTLTSDP